MKVEFEGAGEVVLWGDPAKAVAVLLIFNNGRIIRWTQRGVEVDVGEEVYEALRALERARLSWRDAVKMGFLKSPIPEDVIRALCVRALVGGAGGRGRRRT